MSKFLAIGDVAARTGLSEATLRAWERRHGFPSPQRLEGGHRRYSPREVARIERVREERNRGLSVAAAIARVAATPDDRPRSVFASLRAERPDLDPELLRKRDLARLSAAIEEESCARAERAIIFGGFQRVRFYRGRERRWRDLARTAEATVVYADFRRPRQPRGAPAELPVRQDEPLSREWMVVCDAAAHSACLAAWELPGQSRPDSERLFEAVWSLDPAVVREAALAAARLAAERAPALSERMQAALADRPLAPLDSQLRLATAIAMRAFAADRLR